MTAGRVVEALGEAALRVTLSPDDHARSVLAALGTLAGVHDVVVTERHACVYFEPSATAPTPKAILEALERRGPASGPSPAQWTIAVRYDGEDLASVADATGLSPAQVVEAHAAGSYRVAVVGFLPGFAYLAELDRRLVLPRRANPRTRVPAGSVAIAGARTGIYPFASPGGWHLLGRAIDFVPFDSEQGARLALGDRVRFVPA